MIPATVLQTKTAQETFALGESLAKNLHGGEVIALHGDLGSGKTVFAQGLAHGLGVTQRVTSPTFLIVKHYSVKEHQVTDLYHVDLYRLTGSQHVLEVGLADMLLEPHAVTVIEWPEKMEELLPAKTIHKTFLYDGEDKRLVIDGMLAVYAQQAVTILKQGGIVIFPTDTAFGMGCRIDDQRAVEKLFSIRQRPLTKATPVLFDSIGQVKNYVGIIPRSVNEDLMQKFWPGALTIILPAQIEKISRLVLGGGSTIGVRIPNNEILQNIIKEVGVPIIGTSANFHGQPTPYEYTALDPKLSQLVDLVVPGVCTLKKESTVVDSTVTPWKVIRQGAIHINNYE